MLPVYDRTREGLRGDCALEFLPRYAPTRTVDGIADRRIRYFPLTATTATLKCNKSADNKLPPLRGSTR